MSVGDNNSIFDYKRSLTPTGTYVMIGGSSSSQMFQTMLLEPQLMATDTRKYHNLFMSVGTNDLSFIKDLIEAKQIRPVIDTIYQLKEVSSAIQYLEQGSAIGKVVIQVLSGD